MCFLLIWYRLFFTINNATTLVVANLNHFLCLHNSNVFLIWLLKLGCQDIGMNPFPTIDTVGFFYPLIFCNDYLISNQSITFRTLHLSFAPPSNGSRATSRVHQTSSWGQAKIKRVVIIQMHWRNNFFSLILYLLTRSALFKILARTIPCIWIK